MKEKHPSLVNYIPSEEIPEGYELQMVTWPSGLDGFCIEWLIKTEDIQEIAA